MGCRAQMNVNNDYSSIKEGRTSSWLWESGAQGVSDEKMGAWEFGRGARGDSSS